MRVEPLELELAPDLIDLISPASGGSLLDRVKVVRRQIAFDLGLVIPLVRTRDNLSLPPSTYVVRVNGIEAGRGEAPPGCVLVLADGDPSLLPGRPTTEPVFGLPAAWVPEDLSEGMEAQGATVVDRGSVIVTHLSEIVRRHAAELLSRQDVQALVDAVREVSPAVATEVGSEGLGLADVQRVLRGLLAEGVPVRDLVRILEAVTARSRETRDTEHLLETARQALAGAISAAAAQHGVLHAVTLDPLLEQSLLETVRPGDSGTFLALEPSMTADLIESLNDTLVDAERQARQPVLLCSSQLRPSLRRVAASRPQQIVMSYGELDRSLNIEPVGVVNLVARSAAV
jgi:flagellar biosynthesis protein FlhA